MSHRGRPAARGAGMSSRLTLRQQRVLDLIWDGHRNPQIAGSMGISVRTVEVHRADLMRRLKVTNIAQLIRTALRDQLIHVERKP